MTGAATSEFHLARDFLLNHRDDYETAYRDFRWPQLTEFNWALDHFDVIAAGNDRPALRIVSTEGEIALSFAEMAERSNQVANHLRRLGVGRGDRLLLVLGNCVELWETILASMKLGAVIIPAAPQLGPADLRDRVDRGGVDHVVAGSAEVGKFADVPGEYTRVAVGDPVAGWHGHAAAAAEPVRFTPDGPTRATDRLLVYFTSGTTALPKLVEHTHETYPVGHLSTMYWLGLEPGDVHLNLSSAGWAKHAWSSVFAPWNAGATVFVHDYRRFDPAELLTALDAGGVTSFCAPPTVWRMLIQADLTRLRVPPRKVASAGEPLNPEIIDQVRQAWGVTVRDGFGQTETTVQVANPPGAEVRLGSMGRPMPGFTVALLDPVSDEPAEEGEICLALDPRPTGVTTGYVGDPERTAEVMRGGYYHTGDVAGSDADGYLTYVGRTDDVFKASDYRISPFELESVLLQHPSVSEAAVVPTPDPIRTSVPKAYVALSPGHEPDSATAADILRFARARLAPFQRVRRLEFAELPKTISGKIRRVELREQEQHAVRAGTPRTDFTEAEPGGDAHSGSS